MQPDERGLEAATHHIALWPLLRSVFVNMIAPTIIYRLAAPHFAQNSLVPLELSGLPPAIALAYTVVRLRTVDFLSLFAAENVVVELSAALLAHGEKQALIGRALENPILALFFLASLATREPLVLSMSRQLSTGNSPAKRAAFDRVAAQPHALRVYRTMTLVWAGGLFGKAVGSWLFAEVFAAKDYLLVNAIWSLATDALLVTWSTLYGGSRLVERRPAAPAPLVAAEPQPQA
jgi:hypothetical protein